MIYTVLGEINPRNVGVTLMHEHILVDYRGADYVGPRGYRQEEVVETMMPYLVELRRWGAKTFVDATPPGSGRDVEVLKKCSSQSGLNIITCTGTFRNGGVSKYLKGLTSDQIAEVWVQEFVEGIGGSDIKPGFIKIALDDGELSSLQEKILRAAARASRQTNLSIQAHTILPVTARQAVRILKEEGLDFSKFIWTHSDCNEDVLAMVELAREGLWLQVDSIGYKPYSFHIKLLQQLIGLGFIDQILLSQDKGWFVAGEDKGKFVNPYHRLLSEFIPLALREGLAREHVEQILIKNPARALNVEPN